MSHSQHTKDLLENEQHELGKVPIAAIGGVQIEQADVATRYASWPAPTAIVSDGAYGLGLFPGDPPTPRELVE